MTLGGGSFGSRARFFRGVVLAAAMVCVSALMVRNGVAAGIVNPHDSAQPKFCTNCHTKDVYSKICDEIEGYCLLGGSVDAICLICHVKEDCCKPGLENLLGLHLGMFSHPSDVETRDVPEEYYPKTLPIQHGRITCLTCHLHTRPASGGYKMLRLVTITGDRADYTVLCHDCHKDH